MDTFSPNVSLELTNGYVELAEEVDEEELLSAAISMMNSIRMNETSNTRANNPHTSRARRAIEGKLNASSFLLGVVEDIDLEKSLATLQNDMNMSFESKYKPTEMRQLALVAHNHMKPAMKIFIQSHAEILKKFRITGTNTTMNMCKTVFGEDNPDVVYGSTCSSGPLGGDAQLAALMVLEDVGGIIFFVDPLSAHPHQADIDSLIRLANVSNIMLSTNPVTAECLMYSFRCAMCKGNKGMFPSFFHTLESPSVPDYKAQQNAALKRAINS